MKKLIVILMATALLAPCYAQFNPGTMGVGGVICIGSSGDKYVNGDNTYFDVDDAKEFDFKLIPAFQYFINKRISVGGSIGIDFSRTTGYTPGIIDQQRLNDKDFGFGIGALGRYYFPVGEKQKAGFFGEAGISYWRWCGSYEDYNFLNNTITEIDKNKGNQLQLGVAPGIFYRPTDCLVFDFILSGFRLYYSHYGSRYPDSDLRYRSNDFKLGGDMDMLQRLSKINIGATYLFNTGRAE